MNRIRKTNAYEKHVTGGVVLYSYSTPVAAMVNGDLYRTTQYYSMTTSRHINQWIKKFIGPAQPRSPSWFTSVSDKGSAALVAVPDYTESL